MLSDRLEIASLTKNNPRENTGLIGRSEGDPDIRSGREGLEHRSEEWAQGNRAKEGAIQQRTTEQKGESTILERKNSDETGRR
jgi:hypothetical protein